MAKIAFLFPGQGSQSVGMGRDLHAASPSARDLFARADARLGRSLSTICFDGPAEELTRSANTQPALLVVSAILAKLLDDAGIKAEAVAGHSLGEYSALHAAGVFDFETAVDLVAKRGEAMSAAAVARPGAMAAVIGPEREALEAILAEVGGVVVVANDNCPGQIVISGEKEAVAKACELAKERGKRVIAKELPVQGAFHSPLMESARERMAEVLANATITLPGMVFLPNVMAAPMESPDGIRDALVAQVTGGVRWRESINWLLTNGFDTFVEVGWGSVLTGLMKRIDKDAKAISVQSLADVENLKASLAQG